ncbi:MAG: ABC transporter permease subunit [Lachnospiraceae bacterium]|nr:ABC transporter permease subunit [Lachnospiraceae bacterium]
MRTLLKHELRQSFKSFIIWSLAVGTLGMICISLFTSMAENMASLAESFSNMGAFSDAFGMSTLSIGTIEGYFATEVGAIHSLGSAMFVAVTATTILSKEEDGHTGEFLYSLPISRTKAVTTKLISLMVLIVGFMLVTGLLYVLGFCVIVESTATELFIRFMLLQMMMNVEICLICTAFSACMKRNLIGAGLGIALGLYLFDIAGRVSPKLEDVLFAGPFGYANATQILSGKSVSVAAVVVGVCVIVAAAFFTYAKYTKKDMAS